MRKTLKISKAEKAKLEALTPIIQFAEANYGFAAELTRRLSEYCVGSRPVSTMVVSGWLQPDPKKRIQPRLGMGLILIEQGTALMKEWEEARPK